MWPTIPELTRLLHEVAVASWPGAFVIIAIYYRAVVLQLAQHACSIIGANLTGGRNGQAPKEE